MFRNRTDLMLRHQIIEKFLFNHVFAEQKIDGFQKKEKVFSLQNISFVTLLAQLFDPVYGSLNYLNGLSSKFSSPNRVTTASQINELISILAKSHLPIKRGFYTHFLNFPNDQRIPNSVFRSRL